MGWPDPLPDGSESPYQLAYDVVSLEQVPKGHYPYYMGYRFSTYGSGYNKCWRWDLDRSCGFNAPIRG